MIDLFQLIRINDKNSFIREIDDSNIQTINESGQNLLHETIAHKSIKLGDLLISRGIDVNHKDNKGQTPLHYAAAHKTIKLSKSILEHGGALNISDIYGNQPLWTAVFYAHGQYDIVNLYVDKGADINHLNNNGRSPLSFALQIKEKPLIEILGKKNQSFS